MNKAKRIVTALFCILLCAFFIVSVVDTQETRRKTNFDKERILAHIEKLCENGPRSLVHKEANEKAVEYIAATMESYGAIHADTTEVPAYLIHDYSTQGDDRYQDFELKNVIVYIPSNAPEKTEEVIMFMAHFDSVPMGDGASDDAVACATMLEAIRYYTEKMAEGYTLKNDLLFCFVNGEEYSLFGSEAFMGDFYGFDNVQSRIKFGVNLESRGTSGTLIMFETAKNNYNTVKLFSKVNKSVFTCSIATMVYDNMPNSTDFTTFKKKYQGLNMANILGGENYHTQNDNLDNAGMAYLSQQAEIVDALIEKLGNYELTSLYGATESAIFFSYLNMTTVVYNHKTVLILAIVAIVLLLANVLLRISYRKEKGLFKTAKAFLAITASVILTAGAAFVCYYLFQAIAALAGVIDIHMIGTITYSNTAIVVGLGILALGMAALTSILAAKLLKVERRDMLRAFSYLHATVGIVLSFVLADASYLFIFSGILFMLHELLITCVKKIDIAGFHGELLITALYFPVMLPIIVLATSALGLTMVYAYGAVYALTVFAIGVSIAPALRYITVRVKKMGKVSSAEGALHIIAAALAIFLCVSLIRPNASVNLQGKQNISKLPHDDALVYTLDENGNYDYRIYDLNAYRALKKYAPKMTYHEDGYYTAKGEEQEIDLTILSTFEDNALNVKKMTEDSVIYLGIKSDTGTTFTIDNGIYTHIYRLTANKTFTIKLHSDCKVTVDGSAIAWYKEVVRDYEPLIPEAYAEDDEMLHFNLWLTDTYHFE